MNTNDQRPVFLDLTKIRFPIPAIVSILHRISGVIIFLFIPVFLWLLAESLASHSRFLAVRQDMHNPWVWVGLWILLAALLYHLFAGIRHLMMDMGFGESLKGGRSSAYTVVTVAAIVILLAGIWLW